MRLPTSTRSAGAIGMAGPCVCLGARTDRQPAKAQIALLAAALLTASRPAHVCTRIVCIGPENDVITARSMDWKADIATNLWIFPRGMRRSGEAGANSIAWTSRYGSVIASGYDISTTDGLNESGLSANLLWLVESSYPPRDLRKPGLSIAAWAQ